MSESDANKLEDDVMQALESLRAILDQTDAPISVDNDAIPTLNTVVEKTSPANPAQDESMPSLSLFDEPLIEAETAPEKIIPSKKPEEQLLMPQVSELDKHHGVDPNQIKQATNAKPLLEVSFDEYWQLLEPKLKQVAMECFNTLVETKSKDSP